MGIATVSWWCATRRGAVQRDAEIKVSKAKGCSPAAAFEQTEDKKEVSRRNREEEERSRRNLEKESEERNL